MSDVQIAEDQLLEWGNTPLKAEDRAINAQEAEVVDDEEVEDEELENDDEVVDDEHDDSEDDEEDEEEEELDNHEEFKVNVPTTDPGDFVPSDYSFEVTLDGKTHKITSPEHAEEFADEHAEEFDAKNLLKFMRQASRMEDRLERDKEEHEAKKLAYEEQKRMAEEQQSTINNIANEITYLVTKGKLPKADPKFANADWSDPEVAKQPGVKEQVELLNFMRTENDARKKAGLAPLTSALDAFNAWQLERNVNEDDEKERRAAQARKKASSRVAGTSPAPVNMKAPKGIAVGRAMSLDELERF